MITITTVHLSYNINHYNINHHQPSITIIYHLKRRWQLLFLAFLLGPFCGIVGAAWLKRPLVPQQRFFCGPLKRRSHQW